MEGKLEGLGVSEDEKSGLLRSTGKNEKKGNGANYFNSKPLVFVIVLLFKNSGEIFGKSALFSCAMVIFFGFPAIKLVSTYGFKITHEIIKQVIYFDVFILLISVVVFVATNSLICLDLYRNKTGVREMGSALSDFFRGTESMLDKSFAIAMWVSGLAISVGFGFGVGFCLIYTLKGY